MKVHSAIARALSDCGVQRIFGLLGDANMGYVSQFVDAGCRFVNAVHEGGAVSMADGCARLSGHVEVASVTHGPGLTNTMTALTEAVRAGSAVLLLSGDTPQRRDFVQQIDLRAAASLCGANYRRVLRPDHVVDDIAGAMRYVHATHIPMLLDIGYELLDKEIEYTSPRPTRFAPSAMRPDEHSLDAALGIVASAARPVIVAGVGARGARTELLALADALGAPVATTLLAKDLFRGADYDLGIFGTLSDDIAGEVIAAADCVIAFGASMNHYTTAQGDLLRGKALVHNDVRAAAIGRYYRADAAMLGDSRLAADSMTRMLRDAGSRPSRVRTEQLQQRLAARDPSSDYADASTNRTLDMRTAIIALDRLLPTERVVVTDCGRFMQAPWRYLHVNRAGSFQHTVNFGSIGLGLATSIGAAVARPDEITVAVTGDGGLMMAINEFTTAVREQLPLVVVVLNDGSYGAEWTKLAAAGLDPKHSLIAWPELASVAEALGGSGEKARTHTDLERAAARVRAGDLPLLIDVSCDPTVDTGVLG